MSPNEELAHRIADRLVTRGMIARADADAVATQIAAGSVRQADWEQLIEAAPTSPSPLPNASDDPWS